MTTKELLINEFYNGSTIEEAIKFLQSGYNTYPTERQIKNTVNYILKLTNIDWRLRKSEREI